MKSKIFLEQLPHKDDLYIVTKLVNRLEPKIGTIIGSGSVVRLLHEEARNLTVEISQPKSSSRA